jgi:predicted DCC family thiol-disulfide oxidoreductase YuxK
MDTIIFFDGICNLCHHSINTLIKKDKKKVFKFASLQSNLAKSFVPAALLDSENLDSIILFSDGKFYDRSRAVLKICRGLGGIYNLFLIGHIIPLFIRDALYNFVANNRYKWFGKKDQCSIPTPELMERFLE